MLLLTLKCLGKIIAVFDFLRCGTAPVKLALKTGERFTCSGIETKRVPRSYK